MLNPLEVRSNIFYHHKISQLKQFIRPLWLFDRCIMIFNVTLFIYLLLQFKTHQNVNISERLLDQEFIIIKGVKVLFHLFLNPKQTT